MGLPLLLLALAAVVYGMYGFGDVLLRDYSIYLYGGQRVAEGVPPYVGAFDHKGPLSPMIAGLGVLLSSSTPFGWDDVIAVRAVFFATACLAVVAVYLLGTTVSRSRAAGLFAALTLLGCYAFAQPAASGPEPKTPIVFFEALCLLFAVQKRWFWACFFGALAALVWQPMAVFALVAFFLAVAQPKAERLRATLRAAAGGGIPLVAILAYYLYHDALGDFWDGYVLFNFTHLARGGSNPLVVVAGAAGNVALPYATMLVPILIGLAMTLRLYFLRPFEYRYLPIMLSFPAPILWSLRDFQLADDFYVFLPYAAVGFGAFLAAAVERADTPRLLGAFLGGVLLVVAVANSYDAVNAGPAQKLKGTNIGLEDQREGARQIEERFGADARIASINSPQVLVLLRKTNPDPYVWVTAGVDRQIAEEWPGGFEGWLESLEEYDPAAISFFGDGQTLLPGHHMQKENYEAFDAWLDPRYHAEKVGPFWLFVKHDLALSEEEVVYTTSNTDGSPD